MNYLQCWLISPAIPAIGRANRSMVPFGGLHGFLQCKLLELKPLEHTRFYSTPPKAHNAVIAKITRPPKFCFQFVFHNIFILILFTLAYICLHIERTRCIWRNRRAKLRFCPTDKIGTIMLSNIPATIIIAIATTNLLWFFEFIKY